MLKHNNGKHEVPFNEVMVKLAYAIGVAQPVMAYYEATYMDDREKTTGNIKLDGEWDLTPQGIIKTLDLRRPQFEKTAQWGHFGNGFTWDK